MKLNLDEHGDVKEVKVEGKSVNHPLGCFDANEWAKEFISIVIDGKKEIDLDLMRAWFANAIMTGFDHGRRKKSESFKHLLAYAEHRPWCNESGLVGEDCECGYFRAMREFEEI